MSLCCFFINHNLLLSDWRRHLLPNSSLFLSTSPSGIGSSSAIQNPFTAALAPARFTSLTHCLNQLSCPRWPCPSCHLTLHLLPTVDHFTERVHYVFSRVQWWLCLQVQWIIRQASSGRPPPNRGGNSIRLFVQQYSGISAGYCARKATTLADPLRGVEGEVQRGGGSSPFGRRSCTGCTNLLLTGPAALLFRLMITLLLSC